MTIAIVLVLILALSIWFHFAGPWDLPALASNWGDIDLTIGITLVVTGVVFIAVILFTAYAVVKFRYRPDRQASYEPENKKLELWLTGLTSVGIIAMLAPGLAVYSDIVSVPDDAMEVEVLAKQWTWGFRFPGDDGILGKSSVRLISSANPFGLDPKDPASLDDRVINANQFTLPVDRPINVKLRSIDVLHDFYVPQIRNKIDAVPGIVTSMWFTPTRTGDFEILCAEYCGVGHYNMRGGLTVASTEEFDSWLASQPTFAESQEGGSSLSPAAQRGEVLSQEQGCLACHGFAASPLGPSWQGLYGREERMTDGRMITADEAYIARAIREPAAEIVEGYGNVMPPYELSDEQIADIIAYIKEAGGGEAAPDDGASDDSAATEAAAAPAVAAVSAEPLDGATVAQTKGCLACHSIGTDKMIGPPWGGLAGSSRKLKDGSEVVADAEYLRLAIVAPAEQMVHGYPPVMPVVPLTDEEVEVLVQYLIELGAEQ
ncbi:c-type cytochrome [Ferrimonas marina]|uniref:cytochrome-c oxidase n=1 Tax=Ferrimonas marina TaxID=299255 RepID=A0A1M5NQA5_9GAMM|nr:c-type cytochrome [Ferrimonas marina]SHG91741.1 cytochrome c oxidase subunit 2 [Ferrimonas marina]